MQGRSHNITYNICGVNTSAGRLQAASTQMSSKQRSKQRSLRISNPRILTNSSPNPALKQPTQRLLICIDPTRTHLDLNALQRQLLAHNKLHSTINDIPRIEQRWVPRCRSATRKRDRAGIFPTYDVHEGVARCEAWLRRRSGGSSA